MDNIIFRKSWFKTLKRWEPKKVYEFISLLERFVDEEELNVPENMMDFWDQVEPLLKSDLEKYQVVVERNKQNGCKGGRPPKNPQEPTITQHNPMGYLETQPNPENLKEKEKDNKKKEKSIDNKPNGFEKLLKVFPTNKVYSEHECLAVWDSLTQEEKQKVIKHSVVYVRELTKKNETQFMKNLKAYLESRVWDKVSTSTKPKDYGRAMTKGGVDGKFVFWYAKQIGRQYDFDYSVKQLALVSDEEYKEIRSIYEEETQNG